MQDIREAVRDIGISGQALCVHSSLRSFGWVEGGALAVVHGLLAEGCTIMVPTFSWMFAVPPTPNMRRLRNGWDYDNYNGYTSGIGRIYTPDTVEIDEDMGSIPSAVVAMPQRTRGNHPLCSFTAVGPLERELVLGQRPLNLSAPLQELARANGSVILMGVGLDTMTILHLAERMSGRNLFRRWANGPDGQPMEVEVGGCGDGFGNLEQFLSPLARTTKVGRSTWRIFPAKATLETAERAIRKDPWLTHCSNSGCGRCRDAVAGGPIL